MIDTDKWREIFNSIQRHPLRTILTALGVFWGIFMLILLLGAGDGLQNGVEYEFRDDAINSMWIRNGTTSMPYRGLPKGRRIEFTNEDYDMLREQFDDIEHLTGRYYLSGDQMTVYKDKRLSFTTRAVHPGHHPGVSGQGFSHQRAGRGGRDALGFEPADDPRHEQEAGPGKTTEAAGGLEALCIVEFMHRPQPAEQSRRRPAGPSITSSGRLACWRASSVSMSINSVMPLTRECSRRLLTGHSRQARSCFCSCLAPAPPRYFSAMSTSFSVPSGPLLSTTYSTASRKSSGISS